MKEILVIDDARMRKDLLSAAEFWADMIGAHIRVLSMIDESAVRDTTRTIGVIGKVAQAVKSDFIEETRETICAEISHTRLRCEDVIVKIGIPLDEIKRSIDSLRPDLVVLSKGLKSGVIHITGEIIGFCKGNCLVVTDTFLPGPFERLLLATDGSEKNKGAEEDALLLTKRFGGTLYVLTVVDFNEVLQIHAPELLESFFVRARENVQRIVKGARDMGIRCTGLVKEGSISDTLVQVCRDVNPGIVILGSEGRTGLSRLLMGSVANSVMKKISSPILVIKKKMLSS